MVWQQVVQRHAPDVKLMKVLKGSNNSPNSEQINLITRSIQESLKPVRPLLSDLFLILLGGEIVGYKVGENGQLQQVTSMLPEQPSVGAEGLAAY